VHRACPDNTQEVRARGERTHGDKTAARSAGYHETSGGDAAGGRGFPGRDARRSRAPLRHGNNDRPTDRRLPARPACLPVPLAGAAARRAATARGVGGESASDRGRSGRAWAGHHQPLRSGESVRRWTMRCPGSRAIDRSEDLDQQTVLPLRGFRPAPASA
jgi:hypothetical protein